MTCTSVRGSAWLGLNLMTMMMHSASLHYWKAPSLTEDSGCSPCLAAHGTPYDRKHYLLC